MKKILIALATVAVCIVAFSCSSQKKETAENFCIIAEVDSTFRPSRYGLFNLNTKEFRNIEEDEEIEDEMYMATFTVDTESYERMLRGNITDEEYLTLKDWVEKDAALEDEEEYDEEEDENP